MTKESQDSPKIFKYILKLYFYIIIVIYREKLYRINLPYI